MSSLDHLRWARLRGLASSLAPLIPDRLEVPARFWAMRAAKVLEPHVDRLADWVRPESEAADVGANYGAYTYALARLVRHVHAFEPLPDCARVLGAWRAPNVTIHEVAISDRSGRAVLQVPVVGGEEKPTQASLSGRQDGRSIEVRLARLDDFEFDDLGFVKVDVEGHERAVIEGGIRTLAQHRPIVLIELVDRLLDDGGVAAVVDLLADIGYRGELLTGSGSVPAESFEADRHQSFHDGVRGPGYANMFLFLPPDG